MFGISIKDAIKAAFLYEKDEEEGRFALADPKFLTVSVGCVIGFAASHGIHFQSEFGQALVTVISGIAGIGAPCIAHLAAQKHVGFVKKRTGGEPPKAGGGDGAKDKDSPSVPRNFGY